MSGPGWLRLRVAIFCLALFVPLAIMLTPSLRSWAAARKLEVPEWSWRVGDIKRFPPRFQQQFDAALPFRVELASLSRSFYVDWLQTAPIPEAVLGTDGWLYYVGEAGERRLDRHVRGRDPFTRGELELWREALLERTRYFRSIGAKYVFVIAPNKETAYPEHLPGWIGPRIGPTRLDQLIAYLQSTPEVTVIDLRSSLNASKHAGSLYFRTDTHWNTRGAHAAYQEIMRTLAPDFPALAVRSWTSFDPRIVARPGMDIARVTGLGGEFPEPDFELAHSACAERRPIPIPIPAALQSRLTSPPYATRCDVPGNVDAVIFHDSFGVALVPILVESFRSSADFSTTLGQDDKFGYGMPEKLKANLVLEIMVERSLDSVPQL
jgi:hypothetical protein